MPYEIILGVFTAVHYKGNSLLNPSAFVGTACTYFILHNITTLQLDLYVAIWYGIYVLKYYLILVNVTV